MFAVALWGWGVGEIAIAVVAIAAIIACVFLALREFKVPIPGWAFQVFWIVVIAFVIILAIRLIMEM